MQKLWQEKIDWDEEIPDYLRIKWQTSYQELQYINKLRIPRWIGICINSKIEIHGFSDASSHAYGACIYVRSIGVNDHCTTRLLCAKSRITPLKTVSIPRLELCATVLLARMSRNIIPLLR